MTDQKKSPPTPNNEKKDEKITSQSTIEDLLNYLSFYEKMAGDVCMASEGTSGCDEASKLQALQKDIQIILNSFEA